MPVFACKTITRDGAMIETKVEAITLAQARASLQRNGAAVINVREMKSASQSSAPAIRKSRKHSQEELAGVMMQMSIMIRAGVPLVESLSSLAEQSRSDVLSVSLNEVSDNVSQGMSLSEAFARHPKVFPGLAVEMAKISEAGGNLAESLGRLAEHMESGAEIRRKVKSALSYPMVVCVISVLTTIIMMTFIVPRFTQLFSQMGAQIPWTTRCLMSTSHTLIKYWYLFLAGTLITAHLIRRYALSPRGRRTLDGTALRLPLVGDIVTKVVLGRVVATMSTLLGSGIPMVKTLEIAASAADNQIVGEALSNAATSVAQGMATSQALRASGLFPPLVLQMVTSGEKTGELPGMLKYVCELYSKETDAKVKSLTSVIEPVLIVLLGLVVGTIAISVIVPIYSLVGSVK
jgi:type IV pilus assembly protein PilC